MYSDVMRIGFYHLNVGGNNVLLINVLFEPSTRRNLVSVSALIGKMFEVHFVPRKVTIGKHGMVIFEGKFVNEH